MTSLFSIFGLTLDRAVEVDQKKPISPSQHADTLMRGVEVCQCPENFAGTSCEVGLLFFGDTLFDTQAKAL